uniref:DUF148 domain-containing protein n=1 Tax=Parastrongyloides trichosuri TaxID=131310 RepID=A0A0N4ZIM8_PARTI
MMTFSKLLIHIIFIIFLRRCHSLPVEGAALLASKGGSNAALGGGVATAENIKKLTELYGIATQIMNIGGEVLTGGRGGGSNYNSISRNSISPYTNKFDGNSINGGNTDIVRPTFHGISGYEPSPTISSNSFGNNMFNSNSGYGSPNLFGSSSNSGYGGLNKPVQSARMSGLEAILNGFLGSSFGSNSYSSTATQPDFFNTKKPNEFENGSNYKGSNIDAIMNALMRSGAKKAEEAPEENRNFLSQFFGK